MPTSGLQVLAVPHRRCLQRVLADRWCASLKNPKPSNPRMTENYRKWQKMGFYTSLNMNEKGSLLTKWSHSLMSRAPREPFFNESGSILLEWVFILPWTWMRRAPFHKVEPFFNESGSILYEPGSLFTWRAFSRLFHIHLGRWRSNAPSAVRPAPSLSAIPSLGLFNIW